jgi:hypothetical protein
MNHFVGCDRSYYKLFEKDDLIINKIDGYVCFEPIVNFFDSKGIDSLIEDCKINLRIYKKTTPYTGYTSHLMLINKREMILWFNQLKKVVPFNYSIITMPTRYDVTLHLGTINKIKFLWLLTGIRNVYERNSAIYMKELFSLIKFNLVKPDNLINLFKILHSECNFTSGQCWFHKGYLIELEDLDLLKQKINKTPERIQTIDFMKDFPNPDPMTTATLYPILYTHNDFSKESVEERYYKYHIHHINLYKEKNLLPEKFEYKR